ncbi:MAG: hypothetical protein IKJ82_01010 [Oscillospiraceae bacterium]|nr:hypothetical protein [Oscillospiraceae bacterium]
MTYYYGSTESDIKTAEAGKAKLCDSKMIAAFCLANPLEEPFYWFPCDFGSDGTIQYQELYPNAFRECTEGKKGFIHAVEADESDLVPNGEINSVFTPKKELEVSESTEIQDLYAWLMEEEDMGRFRLYTFEQKTRQEILLWENSILRYLSKNKMVENPDCPYAKFVREKLPNAWAKYMKLCGR